MFCLTSDRSVHLQLCQLCADFPTFSQEKSPSYECDFGIVSHPLCPQAVVLLLAPSPHLSDSPGRVDCFLGSFLS